MNEAWFDTGTGKLAIGEEATEYLLREVGHMAVPLCVLLLADDFPFMKGDFERISADKFSPEDGIATGRAMARMLMLPEGNIPMHKEHVRRMNVLGLLPDMNFIKRRYGSFSNFRNLIGADRPRESSNYDTRPLTEIFELVYAEHLKANPGNPMSMQELEYLYKLGRLPSYDYLYKRFGGINKINEYIGYPDIRSWELTDYINYGAQVLEENGANSLTVSNIVTLAQDNYGPYPQAIKKRFGGSWELYKKLAAAEWQKHSAAKEAKREAIDNHFEDIDYIRHLPEVVSVKYSVWAKYHVAADFLHPDDSNLLKELSLLDNSRFTRELLRRRPGKNLADIELIAISLNVFDDIWGFSQHVLRPTL